MPLAVYGRDGLHDTIECLGHIDDAPEQLIAYRYQQEGMFRVQRTRVARESGLAVLHHLLLATYRLIRAE